MTLYNQEIAKRYDKDFNHIRKETTALAMQQIALKLKKAGSVLDFCAGTGDTILNVHHTITCENITGIDISKEMLDKAKQKIPFPWKAILDDVKNIGSYINPESQDLILSHFLYDYVGPDIILNLARPLLKPGGYLSIITTTKEQYQQNFWQLFGPYVSLIRFFKIKAALKNSAIPNTHAEHSKMLEQFKFEIVEESLFIKAIVFNNGNELWDFLYHSGWALRYFNQLNFIQKWFAKKFIMTVKKVYPIRFNAYFSIVLARKYK